MSVHRSIRARHARAATKGAAFYDLDGTLADLNLVHSMLFLLANLKAEPTAALSVAALITDPQRFRDRAVCCVISGGNVDPAVYERILAS